MSLSQDTYRDLVKGININAINIHSLNISNVNKKLKGSRTIDINQEFNSSEYIIDGDNLEVYAKFNIKACEKDNPEKIAFEIDFTYCIEYTKTELDKFDEAYIKFFVQRNVPVNIWPYARELISSLTTRMGYPTLIIEPLKV